MKKEAKFVSKLVLYAIVGLFCVWLFNLGAHLVSGANDIQVLVGVIVYAFAVGLGAVVAINVFKDGKKLIDYFLLLEKGEEKCDNGGI